MITYWHKANNNKGYPLNSTSVSSLSLLSIGLV